MTYEERQKARKLEQEENKRILKVKFTKLVGDLNTIAKNDKDFRHRYHYNENGTVSIKVKYGKQVQIRRTRVGYQGYSYSSHRHALRIQTNYYNIGANRLLRDFDSTLVAKALHAKIKYIIPELEKAALSERKKDTDKEKEKRRIKRTQEKLKRKIERTISYAKISFWNNSLEAEVKVGKLSLSTTDGENYKLDRVPAYSSVPLDIIKPLLLWGVMEDSLDK